jgi:hypothetical protein
MFTKKHIMYFIVLFLPMLIISTLLNISYSLQAHDYIQINWLIVILLAIILDAFITWMQTRKDKEKKAE